MLTTLSIFNYFTEIFLTFKFFLPKTKDMTLSSFPTYNNNVSQHLSNGKFHAPKNLSKNKQMVIQKSDKGNSIVIVGRDKHVEKMESFLKVKANFRELR